VGSSDLIFSDFRIIAATNKNLEIEVKEKRFREDLYFRLKTGYIYISPLRKRKEDIIKIAEDILKKINKENNDNKNFSNDFLLYLYNKKLKGNFRELSHIIKSAYLKTFDNIIKSAEGDLEFNFSENNKNNNLTLEKLKKNYIKQILKQTNNKVQTCEVLGISRSQLYKYIKKYNLYTKN
jgi:transcriptional regulator with PAS, ATPase and Fis domain